MKQTDRLPSLSILIPRYNFDMGLLVTDLLSQASKLPIETEVIVVDDASPIPPEWDTTTTLDPRFSFERLSNNIGRSRIRNYLADRARYPFLLFLDCDSKIPPLFLQRYLEAAIPNGVVAGGTIYTETPPEDPSFHVHWSYGRKIETKALQQTDLFHSNNFLIDRTLFLKIRFDEQVVGYGHEDTFFRIALQRLNVPIRKIDNPVWHIGLNRATDFLRNTRNAVDNLLAHPEYMPTHPIVRIHRLIRITHLRAIFGSLFNRFAPNMERRLDRTSPSLRLFNLYKLLYILSRK